MPRTARQKPNSGIYHVMIRGIDRQNIFEAPEDYRKMLYQLKDCKDKDGFELYAYCLMPNHIHLLIKENDVPIATTFRRLGSKYVMWFNTKYDRVGHLFQDRFKSEPVENDEYFLTVLRYIHFNPVKAGLVSSPVDYPYSSYIAYLRGSELVDTAKALALLPGSGFQELHFVGGSDTCLDIPEESSVSRVTDEAADEIMLKVTRCGSIEQFRALNEKSRRDLIRILRAKGLSIRQITRLTGESYYTIQKIR